jgi:CBS-domain-containing membrane protein
MNAKKIIFWSPLLAGIGTGLIIGILAYITYESILSGTAYGLWFMASFGSTVINVFGFPKNRNSQPKNVLFGHLLSALVGIIFINFFETSFITLGLAVGVSTMLMLTLKIAHPPAGGTVIMVMIGDASFRFLIFPVMVGAITIIIGGIIYNRLLLKRKYPLSWK